MKIYLNGLKNTAMIYYNLKNKPKLNIVDFYYVSEFLFLFADFNDASCFFKR